MNDNYEPVYEPVYEPETEVVYLVDSDGFYDRQYDLLITKRAEYQGRYVRVAPPRTGDNEIARLNDSGKWEIVPDYRGQVFYDSNLDSLVRINYLGELREEHSGDFPSKLESLPIVLDVF